MFLIYRYSLFVILPFSLTYIGITLCHKADVNFYILIGTYYDAGRQTIMKKIMSLLIIILLVNILPVTAEVSEIRDTTQTSDLPSYFSWCNIDGTDFTTSVKTQGLCPSCEAYGLVAVLETIIQYQVGYPFDCDLSEAHLFFYPGGTCKWGVNVSHAADYLVEYGVPDEGCFPDPLRSYDAPFESVPGWESRTVKIQSWGWVENDEEEIKHALIEYGPLVICFPVYQDFMYYKRGVYRHRWGPRVGGHLVALVGYDDSKQCWIVKNSWGTEWGDHGWFKMGYDPDMFIDGCYGGTGILYVDGVYGNFMPDVPEIYIEKPRQRHTYFRSFELPTLLKKVKFIPGSIPRIIGWTEVKTLATNTDKVEFYLDGRVQHIDYSPPFVWELRAPLGLHTIETYAYDEAGNMSKAITDVFVLQ